jgi:SdrD B-like domain/PKD domain
MKTTFTKNPLRVKIAPLAILMLLLLQFFIVENVNGQTCPNAVSYTQVGGGSSFINPNVCINGMATQTAGNQVTVLPQPINRFVTVNSCVGEQEYLAMTLQSDFSVPYTTQEAQYSLTNYGGAGVSQATAAKLKWIICNYPLTQVSCCAVGILLSTYNDCTSASDVPGTQAILDALNSANPQPDGTEGSMVFYKHSTGRSYVRWSASCPPPATAGIGNWVWNDANNDGIQNNGETGIDGVTVTLTYSNGTTVTQTTSSGGYYFFGNLPAGTYSLSFTTPSGYTPSPSNAGGNDALDSDPINGIVTGIVLTSGQINDSVDAGFNNAPPSVSGIGNYVWNDANNDGIQNNGEVGIANVTVTLTKPNGTTITTTTDGSGFYFFGSLAAGTYSVTFATPSGYSPSPSNVGNDALDSDPINGTVTNIVLGQGQVNDSVDAGFYSAPPNVSGLGDYVWNDTNRDGIQNNGEVGISGVTVTLTRPNGTTISTTTDGSGFYFFGSLAAGTYSVTFTTPSGYVASPSNVGNDALDSDPINGTVSGIVLGQGEVNSTIDAGFNIPAPITGSIGNFVWDDLNRNGIQDAGEPGINGVNVFVSRLNSTQTYITQTNPDGSYSITGLPAGTYTVTFTTPSGYVPSPSNVGNDGTDSDPVGGTVSGIVLAAGENNNTIDAGFNIPPAPTGSIGNFVWIDTNRNGIQDAGELGLINVTVTLSNGATTTTNASGFYSFTGLVAGTYSVTFTTPSGYQTSPSNVGNDGTDSDPVNGTVSGIVLAAGENNNTIDAGFNLPPTACIGNFVWNDLNMNGIQDAGEPGISGVTVTLSTGATTTTDANGFYVFLGLPAGTYSVTFSTPSGYVASPSNVGNDALDSDPINGTVTGIVLAETQIDFTIDAGFYVPAPLTGSIGNFMWNDTNRDGIQNNGELGIAFVSVTLTYPNGTTAQTSTDANGFYLFSNLPAGTYSVTFTTPGGYVPSPSNVGNDATDSDPVNGTVSGIVLAAGQNNNTIDAGFNIPAPTASIGNFVWDDVNRNGIQDPTEVGISGVLVTLSNGATTTTNASGFYSFTGLPAGTYSVTFTTPSGFVPSPSNVGNDATDSDPVNGTVSGIILTEGQINNTIDAGFNVPPTASIGNFVWNDVNRNGIQDAGEPGISGVLVTLSNGATTTTNASGFYSFTGLPAGTYSVTFNTPAGFVATPSNVGNDATDSDPINGTVSGIVLTEGQINNTIDAGFNVPPSASIGNFVWNDTNRNGIQDAGEPGISGVLVTLSNGATTTTNASGFYSFTGLPAGTYSVTFNTPAGFVATPSNVGNDATDSDPINGTVSGIVLAEAETNNTIDAGFNVPATAAIGNFVWNDVNRNGIQDAGEPGISGVTVTLSTGATTTTNATGFYSFTGLPTGTYSVTFTTPSGYTVTPSNVGSDATDSDPVNGVVSGIVLAVGEINNSIDAGYYQANLTLGNHVWYDKNNNGIKDAGELGIAGAIVNLYADANNDNVADGAALLTTTTDANGLYSFTGLAPNTYIVGVITPSGYAIVTTNGGDADNDTDNDNNGVNTSVPGEVRSLGITLADGTEPTTDGDGNNGNLTVDFGFRGTGSIGNFVFNDVNGDGIQNPGEVGIPNAIVTLTLPDGTTVSTTTDASGNYNFPNLPPGSYCVAFTTPAGLTSSPSNSGADDAVDSDPVNGSVCGVLLTAGQVNNTIDAGFYAANVMSLGNVVWYDKNNNGIKDAGEPGIAGVVVKLYFDANNDNSPEANVATTTTNASGIYSFTGLVPNNYLVFVTIPAGYAPVTTNGGDPDNNIDNDNNGVDATSFPGSVISNAVTLALTTEPTNDGDGNNGNQTVDFGFRGTGSIGNFVFNDVNGDGIQNPGELGIPNATVTLTLPDGTTVSTTTDANGNYNFPNLPPGSYCVAFTTPAGLLASPSNAGADDAVDSDPVAGSVCGVVLTAGQVNNTVDAGFYSQNVMSLGNTVWYDKNSNRLKDAGEPGIAGLTVRLYLDANDDNVPDGASIATTTTDANGIYNFTNLAPGKYLVGATIPTGYTVMADIGSDPDDNIDNDNNAINVGGGEMRTRAVTLVFGTEPTNDGDGNNGNLTVDLGLIGTASIGNFVFNDLDGNGIQDAGEVGIPNAVVTLTFPDGTTTTTTTDANGNYNFPNLVPGSYCVAFVTPAGLTPSPSNAGADDAVDSDPVAGSVCGITLTAGQVNNTVDAGFYLPTILNLGNFVWYDKNNNGIKDAGEPGIQGVAMFLYQDANNDNIADAGPILNNITDANGFYSFTNLVSGNYIVRATTPLGYARVAINGGDPDNNIDNDNNGILNGTTYFSNTITLVPTTEPTTDGDGSNGNLTLDFAFTGSASIGNFVFNDANGNGIQDATEVGIPNATVTLTRPDGTTVVTTTDAAGNYNFPNLIPGTYSVAFTTPAGLFVSPSNAGLDDNLDSDPIGGVVSGIVLSAGQINNTIDAGFYGCLSLNSGINGPITMCANEPAYFSATGTGSGSVYSWAFMDGTPATATGINVSSVWNTPGEYDVTLTVTKNGCTSTFLKSIVITQAVFANAGPDADICSGSSRTLVGSGPINGTYSWTVIAGDPTSIDNGANQSSVLVSPLSTTTYQLTVSQNGCVRIDQVTVVINVNKNPTADAGPDKTTLVGTPVVIGGSPTGTAPITSPGAALGYTWTAVTGLNNSTIANPTATPTAVGTTNYRVIVYALATACSDTAYVNVTAVQPMNLGNTVWFDANMNRTKDAGEVGIAGVAVKLYADANDDNVPDGASIATTTTNATGIYNFTNLAPGKYIVGATIPVGYSVMADIGSDPDDNIDNDNNAINVGAGEMRTRGVTLAPGTEPTNDGDGNNGNLSVDLGVIGTASLGDFVWYDNNRNGIQDAGETGIPNVTVTLTNPDGSTVIATTNSLGGYKFDNLSAGTYSVTFTTPAGMVATLANTTAAGATDLNDSDPIAGVVSDIVIVAGTTNNSIDAGFHNICSTTISGNVWQDIDEMLDNQVDSIGAYSTGLTIPTGLKVVLVSNTTLLVVKTTVVQGNGRFSMSLGAFVNTLTGVVTPAVPPGSYTVILSTEAPLIGEVAPFPSLPDPWANTGEKVGLGIGSDPNTNGKLSITTNYECLININFGIKFFQNYDDVNP